jgi:hypothetical protein
MGKSTRYAIEPNQPLKLRPAAGDEQSKQFLKPISDEIVVKTSDERRRSRLKLQPTKEG